MFGIVKGRGVINLLNQIAKSGGEAVSSLLRMTIAFDGKLISALVNGKKIKDNILYNIVTIDYLA